MLVLSLVHWQNLLSIATPSLVTSRVYEAADYSTLKHLKIQINLTLEALQDIHCLLNVFIWRQTK